MTFGLHSVSKERYLQNFTDAKVILSRNLIGLKLNNSAIINFRLYQVLYFTDFYVTNTRNFKNGNVFIILVQTAVFYLYYVCIIYLLIYIHVTLHECRSQYIEHKWFISHNLLFLKFRNLHLIILSTSVLLYIALWS